MQKKNWVIPGLLVPAMLLLLSFPGLALAADGMEQTIGPAPVAAAGDTEPAKQDFVHVPAIAENIAPVIGQAPDREPAADAASAPSTAVSPEEDVTPAADRASAPSAAVSPEEDVTPAADTASAPSAAVSPEEDVTPAADTASAPSTAVSPEEDVTPVADAASAPSTAVSPEKDVTPVADAASAPSTAVSPEEDVTPAADTASAPSTAVSPEEDVTPAADTASAPSTAVSPEEDVTPVADAASAPSAVLVILKPIQSIWNSVTSTPAAPAPAAPAPAAPAPVAPIPPGSAAPVVSVKPVIGHVAPGYVVQPGDTLRQISEKTGVPVDVLKRANSLDVDSDAVALPGKPGGSANSQTGGNAGSGAQAGEPAENAVPPVTYRVRKGESLWLIGRNLGVPYREIMEANHLSDYLIYPDQELVIPGMEIYNGMLKYRIKKGDTLYLIGRALGVDFADIMSLNGISDIWIYPDQVLQIPDRNRACVYRVQEGDTLAGIAGKFDVSVSDILGHEVADGQLHVGQVLVIPRPAEISRGETVKGAVATVADDLELLARAIYAEARGEVYAGQVAVGGVIMNRLKNAAFPKTIRDVIFQPGAFTSVDDGQINLMPDSTAYRAAQDALNGADPSLGALYYWNPATATSKWIWSRPIIRQIGNHVFAR